MKALLMTAALIATSLTAAATENIQTTYYHGSNPNSTGFHGQADCRIEYRYNYNPVGGGRCQVAQVQTHLNCNVSLPRGSSRSLYDHEMQHVDINRRLAAQAKSALTGYQDNCSTIQQNANTIGNRIIHQSQALNDAFDRQTNHGLNQQGSRYAEPQRNHPAMYQDRVAAQPQRYTQVRPMAAIPYHTQRYVQPRVQQPYHYIDQPTNGWQPTYQEQWQQFHVGRVQSLRCDGGISRAIGRCM